ncbi:Na+/H+ antiporter [Sciscionella marina]|uniref:Na+/H+ antiporter n=1 Tax=Sciscionella marina TaxID=508770 RepID=UPI000375EAE9|nr:Na+/H+ antiporter [Sciscionella marina]
MSGVEMLLLLAGSLVVTAASRRYKIPGPLVLLAAGLAVSFIPGLPAFDIDPELTLALILPPLLYSASLESSYVNLRANIRPIALLAVGLVLVTAAAVGLTAYWLLPSLSLPAALVLGAIVAPPDAVAATAIGRRLGLPRKLMTLLSGESLGNDATALTTYKVAVAAAIGTGFSFGRGLWMFALATAGGIVIGLIIGYLVHQVRMRIGDPILESAMGLLVPFGAYLIAEDLETSGVLAVVSAGLYLGHNSTKAGYATRLQDAAVWDAVKMLLESMVFALIGLQLRNAVEATGVSVSVFLVALALLLVTILVRIAWLFPVTFIPRLLVRRNDPRPNWRHVTVLSWAGMRGVVSLAPAVGLPIAMAADQRGVILLCAFVVTVGTLALQGLTLPWLINRLGVEGNEEHEDRLAEAQIRHTAARRSIDRLDELDKTGKHTKLIDRLRANAELRANGVWEQLGRQDEETPMSKFRRIRREMIKVERSTFIEARDNGDIDDEVFRRVQRELDEDEAALDR